jgi:hypothetical protein
LNFFYSITGFAGITDASPPLINNPYPVGEVLKGTPVTIGITTNEPAYCSFSIKNDTIYENMAPFQNTGGLNHSQPLFNFLGLGDYRIQVRCKDNTGNKNYFSFFWDIYMVDVLNKSCNDSDGGVFYDIQGTASVYFQNKTLQYKLGDSCLDDKTLLERYCFNKNIKETKVTCALGCANNSCLSKKIRGKISYPDGGVVYTDFDKIPINCENKTYNVSQLLKEINLKYEDLEGRKLLSYNKYKTLNVTYKDPIISAYTGVEIGGVNYGNYFLVNPRRLLERIYDYPLSHTVARFQRDGSRATAYPIDTFQSTGESIRWTLEHEYTHSIIPGQYPNETIGQSEDRASVPALNEVIKFRNRNKCYAVSEDFVFGPTREGFESQTTQLFALNSSKAPLSWPLKNYTNFIISPNDFYTIYCDNDMSEFNFTPICNYDINYPFLTAEGYQRNQLPNMSAPFCFDSEKDLNYSIQGMVVSSSGVNWDSCGESPGGGNFLLTEEYCENGQAKSVSVDCIEGTYCNSGACIQRPKPYCYDSDNGLDYATKGRINSSSLGIVEDHCINSSMLFEVHCLAVNSSNYSIDYKCPHGCKDGVCLSKPKDNLTCQKCLYGCKDGVCLSKPKYTLTCQKTSKYSRSWHTSSCRSSACGKDKYLDCKKKWMFRSYYHEVCQKLTDYNAACSETSTCGSDKEIKRITC